MTGKMGVKTFLVILLMHAWMDEVHPAEVPSKFIGNWKGVASTRSYTYTIFAAITGGSTNSTVGSLLAIADGDIFCPHIIKLTTEDDKAQMDKNGEDLIEMRTRRLATYAGSCLFGKFKFEAHTNDRIVLDWIWLDEKGKATNEVSTPLDRIDHGQLAKKLNECEAKNTSTPADRLREKLDKDKKKQKRG